MTVSVKWSLLWPLSPFSCTWKHVDISICTSNGVNWLQMMFAILAAVGVFLLVPRGISIGEVQLQSDHMSWNTTRGTYQLKLLAKIPIYNPNYVKVTSQAPHALEFIL